MTSRLFSLLDLYPQMICTLRASRSYWRLCHFCKVFFVQGCHKLHRLYVHQFLAHLLLNSPTASKSLLCQYIVVAIFVFHYLHLYYNVWVAIFIFFKTYLYCVLALLIVVLVSVQFDDNVILVLCLFCVRVLCLI